MTTDGPDNAGTRDGEPTLDRYDPEVQRADARRIEAEVVAEGGFGDNDEIDAAIRERLRTTNVGDLLAAQGITTVAMDDEGHLVEHRPDGGETWLDEALAATGGPLTDAERATADAVLASTETTVFWDATAAALADNPDALTLDPAWETTTRDGLDDLADFQNAVAEGRRRTGSTGDLVDELLADRGADAALDEARNERLKATLAEWAAEHGSPTPAQQAEAERFFDRRDIEG